MRKLLPVFTLLWAVVATSAFAVAPPDGWNHTHYFEFSELNLTTTDPTPAYTYPECPWSNSRYVLNEPAPDFTPVNCGAASYLWAPVCQPGAQTVEFTKRVWLPGDAASLQATLVELRPGSLTWMEIVVNGSPVLHTANTVHKAKLRADRDAFRYGWNTIEVRARKPKSGACNSTSGPTHGVLAQIRATFEADVRVTLPPPGTASTFKLPVTIRNAGGAVASGIGFSFSVYSQRLKTVRGNPDWAVVVTGPGIDQGDCRHVGTSITVEGRDYSGFRTTCPINRALHPNDEIVLEVTWIYVSPSGEFFDKYPAGWGIDGGDINDPHHGNDRGLRFAYACRPAQPPLCK